MSKCTHASRSSRHWPSHERLQYLRKELLQPVDWVAQNARYGDAHGYGTAAAAFLADVARLQPARSRLAIIDAGANDGQWSTSLLRALGPRWHRHVSLTMIDPQQSVRHNLTEVAAALNATFLPCAAWYNDSTELAFYDSLNSEASSLLPSMPRLHGIDTRRYPYLVRALDFPALAKRELRTAHASLLKLDVEGAEYELLPRLLENGALCDVTHLIVEWHLRALPPEQRPSGFGLRLSLNSTLSRVCERPPLIEFEAFETNNIDHDLVSDSSACWLRHRTAPTQRQTKLECRSTEWFRDVHWEATCLGGVAAGGLTSCKDRTAACSARRAHVAHYCGMAVGNVLQRCCGARNPAY